MVRARYHLGPDPRAPPAGESECHGEVVSCQTSDLSQESAAMGHHKLQSDMTTLGMFCNESESIVTLSVISPSQLCVWSV